MNWTQEIIENEVFKVMKILNISRMPTSKEVRKVGISGLDGAISDNGGYIELANKFGLINKRPIIKWNDKLIVNKIQNVIILLNLDRMPSASEIFQIEGNYELDNIINKSLGYYGWAKKLKLEIKDSETLFGNRYQEICFNELINQGYKVENTTIKAPYDLLVNNNVRIDVKSGCAYYINDCRVHTFGINKKFPTCDLYIIYALDEEGNNIERTFIIPSKNLKLNSMSIGTHSKYNKYINKWDYIDKYNQFYKTLII